MRFGILGPVQVIDGDRVVDLGPPKQRAVLAVLLIEANRVVPLDRLIDLLWGGQPPASATGALQVYMSGLRAALVPDQPAGKRNRYLVTQPPGYLLRVAVGELDAARFETLATRGHQLLASGQPAAARSALVEGLALWRGPALADFAFEGFAQAEAIRLEELRGSALENRIEADLALGNHVTVVAELEALVAERPLQERLWSLLALALYRSGRQGDALHIFKRARGALREELGIEPGPALRRLEDDILRQVPSLDWRPPADAAPPDLLPSREDPIPASSPIRPGRLIGREAELRMLQRLLADCCAGRGGLALISGEPGIGKTRLTEELVSRAAALGASVAWGACHEGEGAPSFWPWVKVLRGLLTGGDRERLRPVLRPVAGEIAQIWPDVKELVPDLEPPPALDVAAARFRLYEAVNRVLAGVVTATGRPLVVVIDDLHWADLASLRVVEFVGRRTRETGVLLVVTFRDVDPTIGGPLAETLGVLAREPDLVRAALEGLSESECRTFIAQTFGIDPASEVAQTVHARTDGNPFFVGELARLLASEGALTGTSMPRAQVPAGVRDVIRRRLARLPEATNQLLAQAAVLGREVDLGLLAVAGRTSESEAADLLDASVAVGILVEDPAVLGRYKFSHALIQETVLGELGLVRQANLHARAAAALRVVFGDDDNLAVELAHHLYAATPVVRVEEAFDAALRASELCQRRLAYEQAEEQLRRALDLVRRIPAGADRAHRELDVQHRLATLLSVTEGYHSAAVADAWGRAHELCAELGDTPEVLASLSGLARLTRTRGQFELSVRFSNQILELARRSPGTAFAVAGHESLGLTQLFLGQLASSSEHLAEAIALADEPVLGTGPDDGVSTRPPVLHSSIACRAYLGAVRGLLGEQQASRELHGTAVAMAEERRHPLTSAVALLYDAMTASLRGAPEDAHRRAAQTLRLAEQGPLGPLVPVAKLIVGWSQAVRGEAAGGIREVEAAIAALRASGWRLAMSYFHFLLAEARVAAGDFDAALAAVEEGLAEAEAMDERYCEPGLEWVRGEALTRLAPGPSGEADAEASRRRALAVAAEQGAQGWVRRFGA